MYTLQISPKAFEDLSSIKEYITVELDNQEAALSLIRALTQAIRSLSDFPLRGASFHHSLPFKTPYHFIPCQNYLIFYRVDEKKVFVSRILYKHRNYMSVLFKNTTDEAK